MTYTAEYPYCAFPFAEWNPVQEKCLPHFTRDCNLVLAASVASGKSAVAEAAMGYELSKTGTKAIYVSPLKALGSEKIDGWRSHPTFGRFPQTRLDGDHRPSQMELEGARLIAATAEALALALRRGDFWLSQTAILVLDEAHLLGDPQRGPAAEAMLMAFTRACPSARVLLLSGTLPNAKEIAEWLKALNGKPTVYIASDWRPVPLALQTTAASTISEQAAAIAAKAAEGGKTLCFVHSRQAGKLLTKVLRRRGVRAAFYSAALPAGSRARLEESFRSSSGERPAVLVTTSALAMGVTL